jgi:hypothetical protein
LDAKNKNKLNSTNYENETLSLFTVVFATQIQAQNTSVNAMNSEISDNLDQELLLILREIFKILNDG